MIFLHFLLLLGSVHHSAADPINVLNIRAVFLQHVRVTTPSTTISATVPSTTLIPVTSAQTTEIETDSDDYKDVDYLSQLSVTKPLTVAGREEESSSTATIVVVSSSSYVAEESVSTDTTTVSSTSSQSEERWEEPASTDSATEHTTSGPLEGSAMPQVTDTTTVVSTLGKTEDGWEGLAVTDSGVASSSSYAEKEAVSTDTTVVSTSSRSEDGWEGSAITDIATEDTTSGLLEGSAIPKLTTIEPANLSAIGIDRIPHKIRHDHSDSVENVSDQDRQDGPSKVVNHTFMETHGLEDDEDYSDDKLQEGSADQVYFSFSMTPLFTETEMLSSHIVEIEHSGLDSTTVPAETTREMTTTSTTTTTTSTTTEMTTPELLLINDTARVAFENIDPEQFLMHSDALNRSKEEVYELLSNIEHLSMSYGSTSRDFGSSYILPVLKSIKYDNNSVPLLFTDVPVNVLVQLNIIHLANFDSQQMEYTIDLELKMRWFDMRLANKYSKPVRIRELRVLEQIWRPDPYFVNSKYSYFHLVSFPNFRMRVMPNGLVSYTMRVTLLPACQMVFCRFPHDRQQCDLMISSIAFPRQMVNLIWSETPVDFATRLTLPELKITKMVTETCVVEGKLLDSTCLRLVFFLERDGGRFIVEKYIPSTLAMMFAWVAPYVPYNYEDVRIITPITVLLTLVQMEKGDEEVRTSYLTSLDTWFAAMKAFSVLSLVESLFVLALVKRSRAMEKEAQRATHHLAKANFILESKRIRRLYHHLDNIARFLSPIFFILFFCYYVLFIAQGDEHSCVSNNYGLF